MGWYKLNNSSLKEKRKVGQLSKNNYYLIQLSKW